MGKAGAATGGLKSNPKGRWLSQEVESRRLNACNNPAGVFLPFCSEKSSYVSEWLSFCDTS